MSGITLARTGRSATSGRRPDSSTLTSTTSRDWPGVREGHLAELLRAAGLRDITEATLSVSLEHPTFDAWWEPFMAGVGPAGSFVASLSPERQVELRELCRARLPAAPFVQTARAWAARGFA